MRTSIFGGGIVSGAGAVSGLTQDASEVQTADSAPLFLTDLEEAAAESRSFGGNDPGIRLQSAPS